MFKWVETLISGLKRRKTILTKNKQSISSGNGSINVLAGRDVNLNFDRNFPTDIIDQRIKKEVEKLKKSRFFLEFDNIRESLRIGRHLTDGDFSRGSDEERGRALVWCSRLLSRSKELAQAEEFLKLAKNLGDFTEAKIVDAFIASQKGDKIAALSTLADIDSNASHSASLMIIAYHEGPESALGWMNDAGYTVQDLDACGKSFLLNHQLQLGRWDEITNTVRALAESDFDKAPVLHHLVGLATLVPTIPLDFRSTALIQVPFESHSFPLASDAVSMDARRRAHQHFLDAIDVSNQLTLPHAAKIDDEYALWLELRDPTQSSHGKNRLEDKLRDSSTALGFVHHALNFGIKLDLLAVERDIDRSLAINGTMTIDAAIARLTLAFMQPTPEEGANYIDRYYSQLISHIDAKHIRYLQIEMFSKAGFIKSARNVLSQLLEEGIPVEQKHNLQRIIVGAQGSDSIESRKIQYETTKELVALINLVAELEEHQRWDDLCEFGRYLFDKTHSINDAIRLVKALSYTERSEVLVSFLKENTDLLLQSTHLRMFYAWGLYHEGALFESRAALAELSDEVDEANYRSLQVNLGIATGDWASLSSYIADEYKNKDNRSAYDLIATAKLALQLALPQAKDLVFEAAAKADGDSTVLAAAYFIATSAGWEDSPQVFQWIEKAAELSGDDGPVQRMSLKDIMNKRPEWERHESETWHMFSKGQIPTFLLAQSLNRTLIDLTTFPALANLNETDPRRRNTIAAYSGKRVPLIFNIGENVAALDATTLLTLSFLKILDVAIDAFKTVYIPHSTLSWLFEERHKTAFHQPSRIKYAHKVRDFLATDLLKKFTPTTVASSDLSAQIGGELAALITEAGQERDVDGAQHIVVRPAPVHRITSLMEEDADLSAHSAILSSCLCVVEKLRQKGQITSDEEKRARSYLQLNEKPWPNQPAISDGAILYLDDLAVTYFMHLGFLNKLKAAGLTAIVTSRTISDTGALISYERIANEVKDVIEEIRASLSSRIQSGQVRVGRQRNFDEFEEKSIPEHPTVGFLALANTCDIAIIDDRFINKHANIGNGCTQKPIFSTLDLLDALVVSGALSDDTRLEHRTRLRRAGYFFVPVRVDELELCLKESTVAKGKVIETAELKAIRESVLRVRMSDWLQLPEEAPWLDETLRTFILVLRNLWLGKIDLEEVTARSNWLVEQVDIRGWAHSIVPENADHVIRVGRAAHILLLLSPPTEVQKSVLHSYWDWVEERILVPIKEQFPDVYEWLVDYHRNKITKMTEIQPSWKDNL